MNEEVRKKQAKFWKVCVIILGIISLTTGLYRGSEFWTSYVLDIAGPAWGYVLIRVQYRLNSERFLNIRFSPEIAFLVITGICFILETMQLFEIYNSTFDPNDFLAYFAGVLVVYLIDKILSKRKNRLQQKI